MLLSVQNGGWKDKCLERKSRPGRKKKRQVDLQREKKIFAENMFYVYYSPYISLYVEVSVNISFEYLVIWKAIISQYTIGYK